MCYRWVVVSGNGPSPLRLELFHYVQKVIIDLRLVAKLQLHLVQVRQSILHLRERKVCHQSTTLF